MAGGTLPVYLVGALTASGAVMCAITLCIVCVASWLREKLQGHLSKLDAFGGDPDDPSNGELLRRLG